MHLHRQIGIPHPRLAWHASLERKLLLFLHRLVLDGGTRLSASRIAPTLHRSTELALSNHIFVVSK